MNNFEDWLIEIEAFHLRLERVYEDTVNQPKGSEEAKKQWETVKGWLKAAYQAGCETSKIEAQSLINSLKEEIKIQRKEIAGLREERRCILDADKPPEMGFESI
jgi:hypothetical protein